MFTSPDRRRFLRSLAAMAAVGAARPMGAIEPLRTGGAAKYGFSLAAYSFRDLLQRRGNDRMSLEDFIRFCAAQQLDGVELTSYYFPTPVTPEFLCGLKRLCLQLGLDVSGTAVGNDFCLPTGPARDEQLRLVRDWVDHAALLGAPVIRIFAGQVAAGQNETEARRLCVEAIEASCEYAGTKGITLALENHGGLTATPDGMLQLVQAVRSPWFGVNLDTGNFHGTDVYADLARLAPYAVNVQIKVVVAPAQGPRQPADLTRLASILRDVGYRGYIVLEYEEREDPAVACPRHLAELRAAFVS